MLGSAVGSKTLGAKVPTDLKWVEYLYKQRFWKATGLYGDVESSRESEPWLKVRSSHKTDQQGFNLIRAINHGRVGSFDSHFICVGSFSSYVWRSSPFILVHPQKPQVRFAQREQSSSSALGQTRFPKVSVSIFTHVKPIN